MTVSPSQDNPPRWPFKEGLEISVPEAAALLRDPGRTDYMFLDIREPDELAIASIKGAVHITMGDIPSRINQLEVDEDTVIAVICHSGRRSLKVAVYMQQEGLAGTRSVAGGIDWWSLKIDPTIPRY